MTDDDVAAALARLQAAPLPDGGPQSVPQPDIGASLARLGLQPKAVPPAPRQPPLAPAIAQEVPLIALGHWFDRMAAGARQKVNAIPYIGPSIANGIDRANDALGMAPVPSIDPAVQQANEDEYAKLQQQRPLGTAIGDAAGVGAAKTPLGMGMLGALEYGTPGQSALRGAVNLGGGLAGMGLAGLFGVAARGAAPVNPTIQAAQDFANANGGVLTRGQLSGSAFTQRLEKMLASLPGSSGFYKNAGQANAQAATTGLEAVTGGNAGNLIQQAGAGRTLNVDQPLIDDLRNVSQGFTGVADRDAPNGALKTVEQYIGSQTPNPAIAGFAPGARSQAIAQGVPEFVGGTTPKYAVGDTMPMVGNYGDFNNYQGLRSLYGYRAQSGDPADKAAYNLIQDAFDNAAQRSLVAQGADPSTMQTVQQAYAAQKIAQPARAVDANGNVTYDPTKLATAVAKMDAKKPGMIDNLGSAGQQLRQLAAFGQVATPLKSSGTAEGNIAGHLATGGLGLLAGGMGDLLTDGGLLHHAGAALTGAASLYAMPRLVNAAVQGTRNGIPLLRNIDPEISAMLTRGVTGLLGATPSAVYGR